MFMMFINHNSYKNGIIKGHQWYFDYNQQGFDWTYGSIKKKKKRGGGIKTGSGNQTSYQVKLWILDLQEALS